MSKRGRMVTLVAILVLGVAGYASTWPTMQMWACGEPTPREVRILILDSKGKPVPGVTAEYAYSNGDTSLTEFLPGETDIGGRMIMALTSHSGGHHECEYLWGLAKRSESESGRSGWTFLWDVMDFRGPQPQSMWVFRGKDGSQVRVRELDLIALPADQRIPLQESVFKNRPVANQVSENRMIDVVSYVVMIVSGKY